MRGGEARLGLTQGHILLAEERYVCPPLVEEVGEAHCPPSPPTAPIEVLCEREGAAGQHGLVEKNGYVVCILRGWSCVHVYAEGEGVIHE